VFGFVFPFLPREFLLKTSTHVSAELKGKEFIQTIRKAEPEAPGARRGTLTAGRRVGPAWAAGGGGSV
jgi:hypothetical protein